jgi:hypothetical protein
MERIAGTLFDLSAALIGAFFAMFPDRSIRILSYGRSTAQDVSASGVLVVRLLAAFVSIGLFIQLMIGSP